MRLEDPRPLPVQGRRFGLFRIPATVAAAIALGASGESAAAHPDFDYSVSNGLATIVDYTGPGGNVVIPDEIDSYPLVAIGRSSFENNTAITTLAVSHGIGTIHWFAFSGCANLSEVSLPASLRIVDSRAFENCVSLAAITMPGVQRIGAYTFAGCTSLSSIDLPTGLREIAFGGFANCTALTALSVPNTVETLGSRFVSGCTNLAALTIEEPNPFLSSLDGMILTEGDTVVLQGSPGTTGPLVVPEGVTKIAERAFEEVRGLTSITLPSTIDIIESRAFAHCTGLTEAVILGDVSRIHSAAFSSCTNLATITLSGVEIIYEYAFSFCTSLSSVSLPSNLQLMKGYAFAGCTALESMSIPGSVRDVDTGVFDGCTSLRSVLLEEGVARIKYSAFADCTSLEYVQLPDSLYAIYDFAFRGCSSLTSFTIPSGVNVGWGAFAYCTSMASIEVEEPHQYFRSDDGVVLSEASLSLLHFPCGRAGHFTVPDTVTFIQRYAFAGAANLTAVTIPDSVQIIDVAAFVDCAGLEEVVLGRNVGLIDRMAFDGCQSLARISIPPAVEHVGAQAFAQSPNLAAVYFLGDAPFFGGGVFEGADSVTVFVMPGASGWGETLDGRPVIQWNPRITRIDVDPSAGEVRLELAGPENLALVLEHASGSGIFHWEPIRDIIIENGGALVTDTLKLPAGYYRLRAP